MCNAFQGGAPSDATGHLTSHRGFLSTMGEAFHQRRGEAFTKGEIAPTEQYGLMTLLLVVSQRDFDLCLIIDK